VVLAVVRGNALIEHAGSREAETVDDLVGDVRTAHLQPRFPPSAIASQNNVWKSGALPPGYGSAAGAFGASGFVPSYAAIRS
jgi:hypothetical protein